VAHAKQAATLEPDSADAHFALGFALQQSRRFREAAMSFDRAAQCREKNFIAEKHAVGAWLLAGEFASAWDRAERRHTWEDTLPAEYVRASAIEGEWPALQTLRHDARILVVGEHGLGDEVMFGSLLPEFGDLHPRLTVQLDARLVGLFARSLPEFSFSSHDDPTPPHDERVRLVSLPVVLRRDLASFRPARGGFLTADPARITTLRSVIGTQSPKLCGLSWKTINPFDGGIRSIDVAEFCKTLNVDGFRYVNLQYNTSPDEQRILKEQLGSALIDPGVDLFFDIEGVAALIDCCDVVVTVGNSVAHLAGALGRDTRVLIPYSSSWRWFGDSAESLWYSSMELIRQPMVGDWRDPLLRARQILQSFASQ
jgi:hypothetical protein